MKNNLFAVTYKKIFNLKTIKWLFLATFLIALAIPTIILTNKEPDWVYITSKEDLEKINNDLSGSYYIRNKQFIYNDSLPSIGSADHPFTGTAYFDGTNIVFNSLNKNDDGLYGLFPYNKGTISGLTMYCSNITIDSDVIGDDIQLGFVCGINEGIIKNCTTNIHSVLKGSSNYDDSAIAQICSVNRGAISNCFCYGSVNNTFYKTIGGIAAVCEQNSTVSECYVSTQFVFNGSFKYLFGGISALFYGNRLTDCCVVSKLYYPGIKVDDYNPIFGGLVGILSGDGCLSNSYNHIELHLNSENRYGGMVGVVENTSMDTLFSKLISDTIISVSSGSFFSHSFGILRSTSFSIKKCYYTNNTIYDDEYFQFSELTFELFDELNWSKNIWSYSKTTNEIIFLRVYR